MKNLILMIFYAVAVLMSFREASANDVHYEWVGNDLHISYHIDTYTANMLDGNTAESVCIDGFGLVSEPGMPQIAIKTESFVVPEGLKFASINIVNQSKLLGFKCKGAPAICSEMETPENNSIAQKYSELSPNTGIWPDNIVSYDELGIYRDQQIGGLRISPVQYDFDKNSVILNESFEVVVKFDEALSTYDIARASYNQHTINDNDLNRLTSLSFPTSTNISTFGSPLLPGPSDPVYSECPTYLIVSPADYKDVAERFAEWKSKMGYSVKIIYPKRNTLTYQPQLYATLQEEYENTPNLEYILFFGGGDLIYPHKGKRKTYDDDGKLVTYYTDYYYGCLDDSNDELQDVCIGRLPFNNLSEANIMVDKLIRYEQQPNTVEEYYYNRYAFAEFDGEGERDASSFVRATYKICKAANNYEFWNRDIATMDYYFALKKATPKYFDDKTEMPPFMLKPSTWQTTPEILTNSLNYGSHLFTVRGHGNWTQWTHMFFSPEHIKLLNNYDNLPIIFSVNCQSGCFYNPQEMPAGTTSLCHDFLAYDNGGAAGIIGATQLTWRPYNEYFYAGLYEAMFPGMLNYFSIDNRYTFEPLMYFPVYEVGKVMQLANTRMMGSCRSVSGNYLENLKMNREVFHCLGDPSARIFFSVPLRQSPKFVKDGNEVFLNDPRELVVSSKDGSESIKFEPNSKLSLTRLKNLIDSNNLTLVGHFLDSYEYVPVQITSEMLSAYSSNGISDITKFGNEVMVELLLNEDSADIATYDIYGNLIDESKSINGKASVKCNKGVNIIVLKENGAVIDSKQILY